MNWQTIIQPILLMVAAAISAPLAYYAWRRRETPGANSLVNDEPWGDDMDDIRSSFPPCGRSQSPSVLGIDRVFRNCDCSSCLVDFLSAFLRISSPIRRHPLLYFDHNRIGNGIVGINKRYTPIALA